jgi:hypothetical protein
MGDRPVGHMRVRRDDPLRGGTAVGLRQRQPVGDVLLDRAQEDVRLASIEEDVDFSRLCKEAAIRRRIPSITRMVRLFAKIGGNEVSVPASRAVATSLDRLAGEQGGWLVAGWA